MHLYFLLLFVVACGQSAFGAERDLNDWKQLSTLTAGQRVEIISGKLKRFRGQFVAVDSTRLKLQTPSGIETLDRPSILRVSTLGRSTFTRNILLGLAIGAGAGLATGAIIDSNYSEDDEHLAKLIFLPIGAGIGAGVGAAIPQFKTIYLAKPVVTPKK